MGIVTTTSETAFTQSPEEIFAFVTNPANWPKTYPGSMHIEDLSAALRRSESTGRPLGSSEFLDRVEAVLSRNPGPGKRGPKPKEKGY